MTAESPSFQESHILVVSSFDELIATPLTSRINALCWRRTLAGDFAEVANALQVGPGITHLAAEDFHALPLSKAGKAAAEAMLADYERLRELGLEPTLDCINGYVQKEQTGPVRTDVCSFHADSATNEAYTYLCTYFGASSEGLRTEEAVRRVDLPHTRAECLRAYGGQDDEAFAEWLVDHYYDLHYAPLPGAQPFYFGVGHLWRIALDYPGSQVPPCIHRAPDPIPGQRRLLLIS